ncbi:LCP family protein [Desulfosporosinus sp. PR]|uniref:LCP family protein n=1 Tax=Candidatus Desulfosporosinus nitrosoreducens TaxID=3401928 RepID=UPI0027EFCE4F|nr:LCP family protein [Desulfosporosinus sp. PR]MDQ7095839.1 LCP family protein [Desulfosporosinus sp. PR]
MLRKKYGSLVRVCKVYGLLFLFGVFLGAGFVLSPIIFGQVSGEPGTLKASEHTQENIPSQAEEQHAAVSENKPIQQEDSGTSPPANPLAVPPAAPPANSVPVLKDKRITVLLVGVDRRPNEKSLSNTDTLVVASVNTENGKIALISIPRDTQITIPGYGKGKINAAARIGKGLDTTSGLIEGLIGQPIDGYILTNFSGFKEIIDTLGGITLTVEKEMHYVTGDKTDGIIDLKKGTQRLTGAQALQYARFRQDALADIARTARQQAVLKSIGKELFQVKTIPKLPWLIPQFMKSVETNLSLSQIWSMANILLRTGTPEVASQTLPGDFLTEDGISYWKVDPERARAVVRKVFEEGKTTSVFFK